MLLNTSRNIFIGASKFFSKVFADGASNTSIIGSSFSTNFVGVTKALIKGDDAIESFKGRDWAKYIFAGGIMATSAVSSFSNFLNDSRRLKEIANEQSNFYTSREAATWCHRLSSIGLASSAGLAIAGLGGFKSLPVKVATTGLSILAGGSVLARNTYKWLKIDVPFKSNSDLGLLSLNKPIFRVTDPSSPYYMMSDSLEDAINKRKSEDALYGDPSGGYHEAVLENFKAFSQYLA
jgi:hypothetical protein